MGILHGNLEISGLNERSKKSMGGVITEQSCACNIRVCILEDEIMNYLQRQSKAFIIALHGRVWGAYVLKRFKMSIFITVKMHVR